MPINVPFGVLIQGPGNNPNAWKHSSNPVDASTSIDYYVHIAQKADEAGFGFLFIADGLHINDQSAPHFLNRFEPLTLISALAQATSNIGLIATVSTSYSEPFTVARQLASIDLLSGGRVGWNVVTTSLAGAARNYGKCHPEHEHRYEIAAEHVSIVKGLWDTWEDDAFPRDRAQGVYVDRTKMHALNHVGPHFSVSGPLNIQRSPQGYPVIFQAGSSEAGINLAGVHADGVFSNGSAGLAGNRTLRQKLRASAERNGRHCDDIQLYAGVSPIVGATTQIAWEKYRAICALVDLDEALAHLGRWFDHHDFTKYDVDAPFPDIGDVGQNSFQSTTDRIKRMAKDRKLSLRQVALETATQPSPFIGTPDSVATELIKWIDDEAADGFVLDLDIVTEQLSDFSEFVLPLLKEAGYFEARKDTTLRNRMGLPIPKNRYSL